MMKRRLSPCPCSGIGGDDQNAVRGSTRAVRSPRAWRSLVAFASLCLVLPGGLAAAETGVERKEPVQKTQGKRLKHLSFTTLREGTPARPSGGWCSSRRYHQGIIAEMTRGDRGAGKIWAEEILAYGKFLQETFADDDEGGLSAQEQFKVEFFMGGLAQSVRGLTANMLMGPEQNPASPLVFRVIAQNLDRAPSWPSEIRDTVMCYLEVFNGSSPEDQPFAAMAAYQKCEVPSQGRPYIAPFIRRKIEIVEYCGEEVPFPAREVQEAG